MVNITYVDLLALASSIPYARKIDINASASSTEVAFISYDPSFVTNVTGNNPTSQLVSTQDYDAFHEAGVYNIATGKLYLTSNRGKDINHPITVTTVDYSDQSIQSLSYPNLAQANGGCAFYPVGSDPTSSDGQKIVFCDQGDMENNPSQLTLVDPANPNSTRVLLNNFLGRNFSSLNDVTYHAKTGDLWFTDARYSYWQGYSHAPSVRPQVYRFEPNTGVVQAVADDFIAPNGIEFSPDFQHVYVSDTGAFTNITDLMNPATIYRYDVTADGKRLQNRQVFASSSNGIPDGIHTDTNGNVYTGCGDGIHVFSKDGVLIGKFGLGGVANFAFVPGGIYIFNEDKLWKVGIKAEGRTVRRDFGLK